jgi:alpha-amylase/alpha-mannosidase (GH57 family)
MNDNPKHTHFRMGDLKQAINTRVARKSSTANATNQGNDNVIITIFLRTAKLHKINHNKNTLTIKFLFLTLQLCLR